MSIEGMRQYRVALLGRTRFLLQAGEKIVDSGRKIVLVVTAPPVPEYDVGPEDFRSAAEKWGARFAFAERSRFQNFQSLVEETKPDIAVSVNWPVLLKKKEIGFFPQGVLNAHCGDLPRYRGNACPNWAIINGEKYVGVCIHFMEPGELDSGPVLVRERIALTQQTTITDIYEELERIVPEMFVRAVEGLESGRLKPEPQPQDPLMSLRCYPRRPEDGWIDWTKSATEIDRLIRASTYPFSGAFTIYRNRKLVVRRARPVKMPQPSLVIPGQVINRSVAEGYVDVAAGEGAVRVELVEWESSDPVLAAEVIRSTRDRLGLSPGELALKYLDNIER